MRTPIAAVAALMVTMPVLSGCSVLQDADVAAEIRQRQQFIRLASARTTAYALDETEKAERPDLRQTLRRVSGAVHQAVESGDIEPAQLRPLVAGLLEDAPEQRRRIVLTLYSSLATVAEQYFRDELESASSSERAKLIRTIVLGIAQGVQDATRPAARMQESES